MNRHHYALLVHNCRLTLLLRQEPAVDGSSGNLKAAEWRWTLAEVCDNKWHHYVASVDFPQVIYFEFYARTFPTFELYLKSSLSLSLRGGEDLASRNGTSDINN